MIEKELYEVPCKHCGITYQLFANREDMQDWLQGSGYIQDVLAYLSAAERELLISGTCDNCWENMFGDGDEEDEDEEEEEE